YPDLPSRLGLLDTGLSENELREKFPAAWAYLDGPEAHEVRTTYLARHRDPWYSQEKRLPAPFFSTYMGRGRRGVSPFRFFFNRSQAIATNSYLLMYPKGPLEKHLKHRPDDGVRVAAILQQIASDCFRAQGRVYGGGLYKLEPSELASLPANQLASELGLDMPRGSQAELPLG
ncbi:MAG: hypothetical protein ACRD3C_12455, partial [Vicinamibacterales bacterium]